tara:strand:- start:9280 stop:10881 length:1602 start_codon:yes stop_codon:yes gene_type:complete
MSGPMDSILRFKSRQGGNFTTTLNRVDFDIPEGVYDFSQSFVELDIDYSRASWAAVGGGDGAYNTQNCVVPFRLNTRGNDTGMWDTSAYVRRARLSCDNHGILEDIDRVDVLRNTLAVYERDVGGTKSTNYKNPTALSSTNQGLCPFRTLRMLGEVRSTRSSQRVMIPIKSLLELGKESVVPMDRQHLGKGTLTLDLELANIAALRLADICQVAGGLHAMAARSSLTYTSAGAVVATTFNQIVLAAETLAGLPYDKLWVGAAITVNNLTAGGGYGGAIAHGGEFVITKIEHGAVADNGWFAGGAVGSNNIILTLDKGWINTNLAVGNTVSCDVLLAAPNAFPQPTYMEAQIVLQKINSPVGKIQGLNYMTFTTELHSTDQTRLSRQFVVEPNAVNVLICNAADDQLPKSHFTNINDYRMAVNGIPIIPRDIQIATATHFNTLHYELLSRTFINGSMKLDSLLESSLQTETSSEASQALPYSTANGTRQMMIASPVPITNGMKLYQLQLNGETNGGGALGALQLYKMIVRNIVF